MSTIPGADVVNLNWTGESVCAVGNADGISVSAGESAVVGEAEVRRAGEGVGILRGVGSSGTGIEMGAGVDAGTRDSWTTLTTAGASSIGSSDLVVLQGFRSM